MVVKIADAVKRYLYLLRHTGLFKYLVDINIFHSFPFQFRQPQTVFFSFRSGIRCADGSLTQSEMAGAGKGYVDLLFFTLIPRFVLFYLAVTQHRNSEKARRLKDAEAYPRPLPAVSFLQVVSFPPC